MARSRSIGNVYAELSVKDKLTPGLKKASDAVKRFGSMLASIGTGAALAAPVAAFAGIAASMKSAIDAGGELSDMMARTGADGEQLFVMQRAFENAGIAGDKVPGVLNKMQKALAGVNEEGKQVQTRVFEDLGLDIDRLRAMDAGKSFQAISQSIAAIKDPAKQAALAMEIFGRSGGELLVVMNDGTAFDAAAKQVGGLGKTLSENANRLDAVSDSMQLLTVKSQQVGAEIAVELLPVLEEFSAFANEMDLGNATREVLGFAKAIGDLYGVTLDVLKTMPGFEAMAAAGGAVQKGYGLMGLESRINIKGNEDWKGEQSIYRDGIMLPPEWESSASKRIPDWLKRQPELTNGMTLEESGIPGIAAILDAIMDSTGVYAAEEKDVKAADFTASQYEVNEMQRRGLGMGGESVVAKAQTQVDILQQIRDTLRDAKIQGKQLVWET